MNGSFEERNESSCTLTFLRVGEEELMRCGKWATAGFKSEEFGFRESVRSADEVGRWCVYAGKSE